MKALALLLILTSGALPGSGRMRLEPDRISIRGSGRVWSPSGSVCVNQTNQVLHSEDLDIGWSKQGVGTAVSANNVLCPLFNGTRMDLVTLTPGAVGDGVFQAVSTTNGTPIVASIYYATKSGGVNCTLAITDAASGTPTPGVMVTTASVQRAFYMLPLSSGGTSGPYIHQDSGANCTDVCLSGGQLEFNRSVPSGYIQTTTAPVTVCQ